MLVLGGITRKGEPVTAMILEIACLFLVGILAGEEFIVRYGLQPAHFQRLHEMPFGVYEQLTGKFWTRWIFLVTNTGR